MHVCASILRRHPIHPRRTAVTWIISIFAPAKVSRRDYRGATRFHPRQEREREKGERRKEKSAPRTPGLREGWRLVTRLRHLNITVNRARPVIRMPAQVPRGYIYQDGEIGGARHTGPSFSWDEKGRKKTATRSGWVDQLEETGDCRGTERTKLSRVRLSRRVILTLSS